jgi:glycosyltransferase involved in cell wall biosynthesis
LGKKTVILRAPLLSISGYGVHSRQIFKWLLNQDVNLITQIVSWGSTSWLINPDDEDGLIREIMGRSREVKGPADVSVQVQLPNEWDSQLARYNIGVSAVVETDICNPQWITACNQMDHIVVPSNHAKSTLDRTGQVEKPVSVIPESFFEQISNPDLQPLDLDIKTKFNFLVVGQITGNNPQNDRKNLFKTLKWLCEAFAKDPDVGVILKTNSGRGTSIDRKITQKLVNDLVNEIRPGPFPRIHLLHGNLTKEEMASVYRIPSVKAFVSLTRGEGYGLPLLEAAASDIPVIATNWSGHLDFLGKGRFIPVNYVLQPIDKSRVDGQIFIPGSKWAEVLEKDFKKKVKKFRENPDTPTDWAKSLGETVRREFSQSSIEEIYTRELGSYIK